MSGGVSTLVLLVFYTECLCLAGGVRRAPWAAVVPSLLSVNSVLQHRGDVNRRQSHRRSEARGACVQYEKE